MTIPDYQTIMLPLLKFLRDEKEHAKREAVGNLIEEFRLTEDERKELLPSGKQPLFGNRVGWARTYLKKAGLIESTRHGYFVITERGKEVLSKSPPKIDIKFLEQFPEFLEFKKQRKEKGKKPKKVTKISPDINPEEALETAYQELQENLALDPPSNCQRMFP